jgi:hypothetical protein
VGGRISRGGSSTHVTLEDVEVVYVGWREALDECAADAAFVDGEVISE